MSGGSDLLPLLQGASGIAFANSNVGWDDRTDVCDWSGITCDDLHAVKEINLAGYGLEGTLPASLGMIKSLTNVYLGSNFFHGTIPEEVAALPNLVQFDLSSNRLDGEIPLMGSKRLEVLAFGRNRFTGTLSPVFSGKNALGIFDIKYNLLAGTIPTPSEMPLSLLELDLSNNNFEGTVPDYLGALPSLDRLKLNNNRLVGKIPHALGREKSTLRELFLNGNFLSGTVPAALQNLPRLNILLVDDNKLTGTVPEELCAMSLNGIFFQSAEANTVDGTHNEVYGPTNSTQSSGKKTNQRRAKILDPDNRKTQELVRDGCNSIACPVGFFSSQENRKDGVFPCKECNPGQVNPYLGSSRCYDTGPETILQHLYNSTNGDDWIGGESWKDDSIRLCKKEGLTCDSHGNVASIVLEKMNLSGTLPEEVGFLSHLEELDVSGNRIGGRIVDELRFASLTSLDVSENLMTGYVPPGLCKKDGINGNGLNGAYTCDAIACQAGYSSSTGHSSPGIAGGECKPCSEREGTFLASVSCNETKSADITPFNWAGDILLIIIAIIMVGTVCIVWRRYRSPKEEFHAQHHDSNFIEEHETLVETDAAENHEQVHFDSAIDESMEPLTAATNIIVADEIPLAHSMSKDTTPSADDDWSSGKDSKHEVWLDVPEIQ